MESQLLSCIGRPKAIPLVEREAARALGNEERVIRSHWRVNRQPSSEEEDSETSEN